MQFIRILLIIGLIYFLIWIITKRIFPFLLKRFINKMNNPLDDRQNDFFGKKRKKEGEVTIDYAPKNEKKIDKDNGDYVDYEEVKK